MSRLSFGFERPIPRCFRARQRFLRPRTERLEEAIASELRKVVPAGRVRPGARIGVTVGSRGIRDLPRIVRAAVRFLEARDVRPFIIPAMGSHGGATAEAQRRLIAHLGVTEASIGAPIDDSMDTRRLGKTREGVDVFVADSALRADGVLLINRVKPHTDFKGEIESGLAKMCAIGLGKLEGARECHAHAFGLGLGPAILAAARAIVSTGKILGGLAVVENAYHETALVEGVPAESLFDAERRLLAEARKLLGRLPLGELDVLVCDRMGKNISGTGLDTNVIGRSVHGFVEGVPWQPGMPIVWRIVVRSLTPESEGNAVGLGLVDFATEEFRRAIDLRVTLLNALTATAPANARLPAILPSDREAILAALATAPRREGGPILACARDTLELEDVLLSEASMELVSGMDGIEILSDPEPLRFDEEGRFLPPWGAS